MFRWVVLLPSVNFNEHSNPPHEDSPRNFICGMYSCSPLVSSRPSPTMSRFVLSYLARTTRDAYVRQTTHNVRSIGPKGAKLQSYHPEPIFEAYGVEGVDHPLTKRGVTGTSEDAAKAFLGEKLGVNLDSIVQKSAHSSGVVSYQYFRQRIVCVLVCAPRYTDTSVQQNGISVANAAANVALKDTKIVSFGSSFVKPSLFSSSTPLDSY